MAQLARREAMLVVPVHAGCIGEETFCALVTMRGWSLRGEIDLLPP